ncbi:MAG: hypothetical protein OEV00_03940, partial [Acidobacteriota bacterium]|nr:hypothetical protein [Acidobacteriota bacterium]
MIRRILKRCSLFVIAVVVLIAALPAEAVNVTRTSSDGSFLISTKFSTNNLGGMYAAYRINNDDPSAYDDVWVTLDSFTGGEVGLGSGEDGIYKLGPLAVAETKTAYFYLTAASSSGNAQGHTLHVYDRRPDLPGAVQIHVEAFSFTDVETSISASANKVDVVVSGPDPASIGGIITMQVEGRTGTVGSGDVLQFSPAGDNGWPATAFRLISSDITFFGIQGSNCSTTPLAGGNFTEQLQIDWNQTSCYAAVYRFVANASTSQPTDVTPMIHVSSGTQIKHTDPSGFAGLPQIQPAVNVTILSKSVSPTTMPGAGNVTYTVTFTNSATSLDCPLSEPNCNDATLQDIVDVLPTSPAAATYNLGTSTFGGVSIPDPSISGSTLTWTGSFVVPTGGTADLVYEVALPATDGDYVNSVVAHVGAVQIDTTLTDTDDSPGQATANVGGSPVIGIAKDASVSGTGPFAVTLDFYLENFGDVALSDVQVTDDLDTAFGSGNYSITSGPTIVADPGGGLAVNGGFNGSGDQTLLNAGTSSLGIGQTAQLRLVVSVTAPGSYTNSAVAGGDPPSGPAGRVTDDSVAGTDPDADNSGDPGNDMSDTPIDLAENASIGVSKDASVSGTGPFAVTLDFYLENFGNLALSNVQVTDDLDTAFGSGNYSITSGPTIIADPGGGLAVNGGFNGSGDPSLLNAGTSSLGIGQTAQLRLVVSVTAPGSYTNSAVAGGDPPSGAGNRVADDSVDGTDPDADNSGDPGNDISDTPIDLAENASIGVSKDASVSGTGPFAVTLDFYLENFGNVALSNVQVTDDLDTAFGSGNYSITSGPTIVADPGGGLAVNGSFNGSGDQSLLNAGTSSLGIGQTAQLRLVVSVAAAGAYTNSAIAGGDPPSGAGNRVTDDSVDGTDPDADNSGDPGNDMSDTPIDLAEAASIGVSKDASVSGTGP